MKTKIEIEGKEMESANKGIQVGDLFYAIWGYDQTNYDYVIVESVSNTGKTCICRRAKYMDVGYESHCNKQQPIKKGFGKSFKLKIQRSYDNTETQLRGSYIYCGGEEDEHKRLGTLYRVKEGQVFHETDSIFGH